MAGMRLEVTIAEATVDDLYEHLSKLREVGWGSYSIEWHTSRSHLGKQITMSLIEGAPVHKPTEKGTAK